MSTVSQLESLLHDLNDGITAAGSVEEVPSNSFDKKSLATDITKLVLSDIADEDLDYTSSLLLHHDRGILRFFNYNTRSRDSMITAALSILLEMLNAFIPKAQTILQTYVSNIKTHCTAMTDSPSTSVRNAALEVLTTLIDTGKSHLNVKPADVEDIYKKYSRQFTLATTKVPDTVKARILELLGVIAKYHPDLIDEQRSQTYIRWCISTLEQQLLHQQKANNAIVAGAFNGFTAFAYCKNSTMASASVESDKLYRVVNIVFHIPEDLSRFAAPMGNTVADNGNTKCSYAALELFASHIQLFSNHMIADGEKLFGQIRTLCDHRNKDISKLAYKSMEALLKQVANTMANTTAGSKEKQAFTFFLKHFLSVLRTDYEEANLSDLAVSIRGLGYFSKACKIYMRSSEFDFICEELLKKSQSIYSAVNLEQRQVIRHLPSFIQAYTQFAKQMDNISVPWSSCLVKLANIMVSNFTKMPAYAQPSVIIATRRLLAMWYEKGEGCLRRFLSEFFYHALICTCTDVEQGNEPTEYHAYMDMIHFWDILRKPSSGMDPQDEHGEQRRQAYYVILHAEFLQAFIKLINAFNLDITISSSVEEKELAPDTGVLTTVASHSLKPLNQKDFLLFQNLVEFWCLLLPRLEIGQSLSWIHIAGSALIQPSLRMPLVSGFYKMLSALLTVADKLGMFQGYKSLRSRKLLKNDKGEAVHSSASETKTVNNKTTFFLFHSYLKEVWHRAQQFKDELLACCLRLILACPLYFFDMEELVAPLRTAFHLGIGYYPLAWIALDAIERLLNEEDSTLINESFLGNVLPHMNDYLTLEKKIKKNTEDEQRQFKLPTAAERKHADIHQTKNLEPLALAQHESYSLREIQVRILRILARLGGNNKMMLRADAFSSKGATEVTDLSVEPKHNDAVSNLTLAWDPERRLQLKVPFPNAEIEITLDEMLPRICDLAESSPDRQVKVAACELLHALVLVIIGDSAFQARDKREPVKSRYHRLYLRIFPVLLRLATDIDQVARDMFRMLVSQLIHWLTNNAQYENPETIALLQTCIDAACSANAGLRDYGADCIQEFTKWSIKQSKAQENEGPLNIKSLLKRIYNLASHPNPIKRLGASIIFNRLYRIFREEATLVDEFTLELLHKLFLSLRLAENDHPSMGTREQTNAAISHVKRILRVKLQTFLTESRVRRPFPGVEHSDLPSVVEWAFRETGQPQREYARVCMEFFSEFVLGLPGVRNANEWLQKQQAKDKHILTNIYETPRLAPSSLSGNPSITSYLQWLLQLTCALDGYIWLLERDAIKGNEILHQEGSVLFDAIVFFVRNEPSDLLGRSLDESVLERARVFSLYAYTSYRVIGLFSLLINSKDVEDVLSTMEDCGLLLEEGFSILIAKMVVFPKKLVDLARAHQGTVSRLLTTAKVTEATKRFLRTMADISPARFLRLLTKSIGIVIDDANVDLENIVLNEGSVDDIVQAIEGVKMLQSIHLLDMLCSENHKRKGNGTALSADEYCQKLFDKFIEYHATQELSWINILGNLVETAFNQPKFAQSHGAWCFGFEGIMKEKNYVEKLTMYQKYSSHVRIKFTDGPHG
ncbi:hypothetical protein EC973_006106 [Apophysomyces ossiformis]|uniref:Uncharacterized protein n=1 Tax=Apophysomyces ossiformis TaxID=679940 RepID=A0A8H7BNT1_9FUNG|nr:hypothetical protein EC973_006106 [Apophysomyces ossiformis]